jgi:hypothetical protein
MFVFLSVLDPVSSTSTLMVKQPKDRESVYLNLLKAEAQQQALNKLHPEVSQIFSNLGINISDMGETGGNKLLDKLIKLKASGDRTGFDNTCLAAGFEDKKEALWNAFEELKIGEKYLTRANEIYSRSLNIEVAKRGQNVPPELRDEQMKAFKRLNPESRRTVIRETYTEGKEQGLDCKDLTFSLLSAGAKTSEIKSVASGLGILSEVMQQLSYAASNADGGGLPGPGPVVLSEASQLMGSQTPNTDNEQTDLPEDAIAQQIAEKALGEEEKPKNLKFVPKPVHFLGDVKHDPILPPCGT